MTEKINDPLTMLEASWITSHEMFLYARRAGFSRLEALYIIASILIGRPGPDITD